MVGGVYRGRPCWENVVGRKVVDLDRMAAEKLRM